MVLKKNFFINGSLLFLIITYGSINLVYAAEGYPVKPINYIVPSEAGSDQDVLARPLALRLSEVLGQPVVVINKPGAGSSIGFREIYAAKPDGYTIGVAASPIIINKLAGLMPYDHHGYTMLGQYGTIAPVVVASLKTSRPFKNIDDAVATAKSNANRVSISTSAVGGGWWVATMSFQKATGATYNVVPQAGAGALSTAQVAGGHADLGIMALASVKSQVAAGNVRLLAIIGPKRIPGFENIPTLKEAGYDASIESPQVVLAPPKLPQAIAEKLAKAIELVANEPAYQKLVISANAIPVYLPPDKALQNLDEQRKVFREIMDKAGILKEL